MADTGMDSVSCVRCRKALPALAEPPLPGEIGEEIRSKICTSCWEEWQRAEVMVINELRLDFMVPESMDRLVQHMREFLCLDAVAPPEH